jgi:hypothetical protein
MITIFPEILESAEGFAHINLTKTEIQCLELVEWYIILSASPNGMKTLYTIVDLKTNLIGDLNDLSFKILFWFLIQIKCIML